MNKPETKPSIILLVGQIASGKSTLTTKLAKSGYLVSNDDAIVTAVHGGNYGLYSSETKSLYKAIEYTIISSALMLGRGVVVDRTNLTRKGRARYVTLAQGFDVPIHAVTFPISSPRIHAQRRVDSDGRGYDVDYWEMVAKKLMVDYTPVGSDEGFTSVVDHDSFTCI